MTDFRFENDDAALPDVASSVSRHVRSPLDWVGMSEIHLPARVSDTLHGERPVNLSIQAYVNLEDVGARGIHMSRLYLMMEETFGDHSVSGASIHALLTQFLRSHEGLSSRAFVKMNFEYSVRRPALKTRYAGWKSYSTALSGTLVGSELAIEMSVAIPYSSTCPCSAALARQLVQESFRERFGDSGTVDAGQISEWLGSEDGMPGTPHSQRSIAQVKVLLDHTEGHAFPITALIDAVENALGTPVQTAVKREDEKEFARLNGQNLMFCEDAARRVQKVVDSNPLYKDFWVRVNHLESLHAHNAVSIVTKNVPGGYLPIP